MSTKRERGDYRLPGQFDDGYKVFGPKMYNALCHLRGPGGLRQIFDIIYREAPSWGYEWWRLSLSYFANGTGIPHKYIPGYIRGLLARQMIRRQVEYGEDKRGRVQKVNSYSINPNVDEWLVVPKKGLPQAEDRKPGSPKKARSGSPKKGTEEIQFLNTTKKYMSGMTPGRADSLSENPLRRNHPLDDKEKTEFLRILGEFYKEHPHDDIAPLEANYLYDSLARRYPDVDLIFVLQKKLSVWREKTLKYFNPGRKGRALWRGPRQLLYDAFTKADDRIRESEKMKNPI